MSQLIPSSPAASCLCTGRRISGKEVDQGLTLPQLLTCGLGQARERLLLEFTVASCEDCQEPGSAGRPLLTHLFQFYLTLFLQGHTERI